MVFSLRWAAFLGTAHAVVPTVEIAPGVDMPQVNLGTCCGSEATDAFPVWFSAGGRGVDTALDYGKEVPGGTQAELGAALAEMKKVIKTEKRSPEKEEKSLDVAKKKAYTMATYFCLKLGLDNSTSLLDLDMSDTLSREQKIARDAAKGMSAEMKARFHAALKHAMSGA